MAWVGPLITGVASVAGSGAQAWATWWGQNKQEQENQKQFESKMEAYNKAAFEESLERARQWKWKEEDRAYQRKLDSINNTFALFGKNPNLENHTISIWSKGR